MAAATPTAAPTAVFNPSFIPGCSSRVACASCAASRIAVREGMRS
eukprot:CAMPEP_0179939448 /NCGR_PEP_ID=MMETSP0983-20121128/15648_1 /TAXON_ID=483367 /ORGANISM="non described non described, Strain CCMP 2436" /LENGTH=44 /DNA_ID= /DNA_START= /DNA_END= /DNA_ORIENTATION=